jgi:hypothetical protein
MALSELGDRAETQQLRQQLANALRKSGDELDEETSTCVLKTHFIMDAEKQ